VLPAAALVDMDGLLVETESLWFRAEGVVVTELGGLWGSEHSAAMIGGPLERAVACMIEVAGGDHDADAVAQRLLARMEQLLRTEPIHWQPGARELLTSLRAAGVPCALVSASWRSLVDAVLAAVLHEVGEDVFTTTVAGDDLPRTKPHPDPYLEAARRLGVPPARCVVLEDSPTGAAAGLAAGALVVAVPSHADIPVQPGLHRVGSLRDVTPELLGEWSHAWASASAS
jgi:HAD superfamily hydrolase (TIGR01509 family)